MKIYVFVNDGLPGAELTIKASTEDEALQLLEQKLDAQAEWLKLDTVHQWEVYTYYNALI